MARLLLVLALYGAVAMVHADPRSLREFCLQGAVDLGVRGQGLHPSSGQTHPARWCVIAEPGSGRVYFSSDAAINADVREEFAQAYPDSRSVRIVNAQHPPDLAFVDVDATSEAARYRRIVPAVLVSELAEHPEWRVEGAAEGWQRVLYPGSDLPVDLRVVNGRLHTLRAMADLPLRGRVGVDWHWDWADGSAADPRRLRIEIGGEVFLRAEVDVSDLSAEESQGIWLPSGGQTPVEIPGEHWPSRVAPRLLELEPGVFQVRNVRTGFHHLVVDTEDGLVVADAPAGWVELAQIPPADLVPGLGISGLSERLVDFLRQHFPQRPIRAVALTHAHDDHAGGARAFAAEEASVYAPAATAAFLQASLNAASMPADRLSERGLELRVQPVEQRLRLDDARRPLELWSLGANPHVEAMLGVWLPEQRIFFQSDLHMPNPGTTAPAESRAGSECWFASWAIKHLPADARVMSSHAAALTARQQLESWLSSPLCESSRAAHSE
ncbi:MBL fold metallo-hydrolase [Pseudomarimonas arenosa]|uniref:MBL fold metallo-hydrolase n=1 Tax=Pseudomarimonas arenosa TaxID=2774145 RepID=A0AAW3ZMM8_9GAMM|nr:MBL fold metallo-hydrolase [Pseudomarimonas arenosa]MBD8526165.1 MBL fold metallo-hydrolase [Pseudomarimonas arenosa]